MKKLDIKLLKLVRDELGWLDDSKKLVSKIKQTILKAIEKNAPEKYNNDWGNENSDGFDEAIDQYTEAIRKILGK
jgi:ribosome recycling factor